MTKAILPEFEHRSQPVLHPRGFFIRLAWSVSIGLLLIAISLLAGMIGYHNLEHLGWLDSFLNASMLLGGMGPLHAPVTESGKLFAGFYALYCGLAVIAVASVMLAPIAHRLLHKLHADTAEK